MKLILFSIALLATGTTAVVPSLSLTGRGLEDRTREQQQAAHKLMGDHPKTGPARYGLVERAMKVASEADFPYATEDFFKGADKLGIKYDEQDVRLLKVFSIPDKMAKMKVKDEWDKMDARAKKLPPRFFEDYFDALLNVANEEIPGKD